MWICDFKQMMKALQFFFVEHFVFLMGDERKHDF